MIYEKSVIPIIESKYTLFTATEKKIADYFLQCDPGMDISMWRRNFMCHRHLYQDLQKSVAL